MSRDEELLKGAGSGSGPRDKAAVGSARLDGRVIMVTRAQAQSKEITAQIEALGASVIYCPTIECIGPSDFGPLDSVIARIESFDWIVFTSSNAVCFFCSRLTERHVDGISSILSLVTCAIGPATAKALQAAGAEVDVIANDSSSEGALAAIIEFAGGPEALSGVRFLIPRSRIAREVLPSELSRHGAQVEAVEAYQTVRPDVDSEKIVDLLRQGAIDAITFTSPSTVSNFASLVGARDLSALLRGCAVACIGPITAATAREYGLPDLVEPETHTAAALVEVIAAALGKKEQG